MTKPTYEDLKEDIESLELTLQNLLNQNEKLKEMNRVQAQAIMDLEDPERELLVITHDMKYYEYWSQALMALYEAAQKGAFCISEVKLEDGTTHPCLCFRDDHLDVETKHQSVSITPVFILRELVGDEDVMFPAPNGEWSKNEIDSRIFIKEGLE